jgi:hypothetical protein
VLLASVLWVSALSIAVEGNTRCPEPAEVAARLGAVGAGSAERMQGKAVLSETEGALRVQLLRENGTVVGERLLDSRYPCRDLADAAALVLASWQGEFNAAPVAAPTLEAQRKPARSDRWLELGGGLVAAGPRPYSAGGSVSLGAIRGNWGLSAQLIAADFHRQPYAGGEISWNRSPVSLTVRRHFAFSSGLVVALNAGVAGAALFSRSERLAVPHSAQAFDYGPIGGIKILYDAGSQLQPFLSITSAFWLQPHVIAVNSNRNDDRVLPQLDSWLVLGLSWRLDAN